MWLIAKFNILLKCEVAAVTQIAKYFDEECVNAQEKRRGAISRRPINISI